MLYLVPYFAINKLKIILHLNFIFNRFYILVFIFLPTASARLRPWGNRLGHFTSLTLGLERITSEAVKQLLLKYKIGHTTVLVNNTFTSDKGFLTGGQ